MVDYFNHALVGKPTDPDRFNDVDLMEREASYGKTGFALQFMLDTSLSDANRYPLKLADLIVMSVPSDIGPERVAWASSPELVWNDLPNVGFGGDKLYRPMFVSKEQYLPYTGSVMAIDPSGRGKDETAYCVVKILHGLLYVTAWGGFLGGYSPETLEKLARIAKEQRVNHVVVEPNFGDGMFVQLLKPVLEKIHPCRCEDGPRALIQKEKRIIDTLEPVMGQHRLVVDRKLVEQDFRSVEGLPPETAMRYMGLFQLTRITRDKGSLTHDDRLDALAQAVGYWVEHMARDVDKAVELARAEKQDQRLREFMDHVIGKERFVTQDSETTWLRF
jgi:hypothetical protein